MRKLLLDENITRKLQNLLPHFEVKTLRQMNWVSKKNGDLLILMEEEGFEFLVTTDRNLEFQQNLSQFKVRIVVLYLHDNKEDSILPYAQINEAKILTAPDDLQVIPIDLRV